MKFCQLEIVKELNSIQDATEREKVKVDIANSLATSTDEASEKLNEINSWIADSTNAVSTSSSLDILGLFENSDGKKNNTAYNRVKFKISGLITKMLFNSDDLAVNNHKLNTVLNNKKRALRLKRRYDRNISQKSLDTLRFAEIANNGFPESEDGFVMDYILLNHMDMVINAWFKNLISVNNGQFYYTPKHKVRQDHNSEEFELQEPDINEFIGILLGSTKVGQFNSGVKIGESNYTIEKQAFQISAQEFMKRLNSKDYEKVIDNPYHIIDLLKDKYSSTNNAEMYLTDNILASFVNEWLYDLKTGDQRPFFKYYSKGRNMDANGYYPLDIFINSFFKYIGASYYEIDTETGHENHIESGEDAIIGTYYKKILNNLSSVKIRPELINAISKEDHYAINRYIKEIFGFDIDSEKEFNSINIIINKVVSYQASSDFGDYDALQKALSAKIKNIDPEYELRALIKRYNKTNPNSISGSIKNIAEKALPVNGLNSVAGNIRRAIYSNDAKVKDIGFTGTPVYSQGFLYKDIKRDVGAKEKRAYLGTSYLSALYSGLNIKEMSDLSIVEQFNLAFVSNFYNGWKKNGTIKIEAITPSDKKRIPFFKFDASVLKKLYGKNWKDIETNVAAEMQSIHGQYLYNVLEGFLKILTDDVLQEKLNSVKFGKSLADNASMINILLSIADEINTKLLDGKYNEEKINDAVHKHNLGGNNLLISKLNDYDVVGGGSVRVSEYLINSLKEWIDPISLFEKNFMYDINDLKQDISVINPAQGVSYNLNDLSLKSGEDLKQSAGSLYEFFLINMICSENILINTVGLPYSHKRKGSTYDEMDSEAHITMVKRMVALTATGHNMMKGVLTGQPNYINTLTWKNDDATMTAYSGRSTDGLPSEAKLELLDGLMISTRISDNLTKQSITDVKPQGNAIKYLIHDFRPDKGASRLVKMASNTIDNAFIRKFSYENSDYINPLWFLEMQLSGISIENSNVSNGVAVDYNGNSIFNRIYYYKDSNGLIHNITNIVVADNDEVYYEDILDGNSEYKSCKNDLYDIWLNIFGGANSCDVNGNLDESSMDFMTDLVNKLGVKYGTSKNVMSQTDVDQYAKKRMIMYFPSSSAEKSLKPMEVKIQKAYNNSLKRYTTATSIENFGIQLDPDHDAINSKVHEITQMMSYLSEKGLVPYKTGEIYKKLVDLINVLASTVFIDKSILLDDAGKAEYKKNLDRIFGNKIIRVFSDPSLDVISLSNEICRELDRLNNDLKVPYSDHQILFKLHTTIGSYFNKFIARDWPGRGDTLMGSSGLALILEDEDGIQYMADGTKNGYNIQFYLNSIYHPKDESGSFIKDIIIDNAINEFRVSSKEVEPLQSYYKIKKAISADGIEYNTYDIVKIGNHSDLINARLDIQNGAIYLKTLNRPRNLKTKNVVIRQKDENGNIVESVNWWHLPSHELLINSNPDDKENATIMMEQVMRSLSNIMNGNASESDFELINIETGLNLNPYNVDIVIYHDEKLSTNPYSNIYGDENMVISDIMQMKENWFYDNLLKRCKPINEKRPHFYTSSGSILVFVDKNEKFDDTLYTKVTPVVSEDGYKTSGIKYIVPKDAKIYTKNIDGINIEYVVCDSKYLPEIISGKSFIYYRGPELGLNNIIRIRDNNDLMDIAKKQYEGWLDSHYNMVSRIPAQALSFGMIMKTVGYLPWKNNVSMVNDMHVYLEGSDYDIDKITMMFKALASNGIPVNDKYHKIYSSNTDISDSDEISINFNNSIASYILLLNDIEIGAVNGIDVSQLEISANKMRRDIINYAISSLENHDIILNNDYIINQVALRIGAGKFNATKSEIRNIINEIKHTISLNDAIISLSKGQTLSLQNMILDDIKSIYDDPTTYLAATTPTTMAPINDVVEDKSIFKKKKRPHISMTTGVRVNRTTAVGKAGVGITANGQKAAYAIEYYTSVLKNNDFSTKHNYAIKLAPSMYIDGLDTWSYIVHPGTSLNARTYNDIIQMVIDNGTFDGRFFKYNYGQHNLEVWLDDQNEHNKEYKLKNNGRNINIGDQLDRFYPTDIISSLISSCTDNAKEMKIDLINGTEETLPGYIFCIMLGMNIKQAYNIFKHKLIPILITESRGDVYKGGKKNRISKVINTLISNEAELAKFISKYNIDFEIRSELATLKQIFDGADVLTSLSNILGINGGIEVNFGSATLYREGTNNKVRKWYNRNEGQYFDIYDFVFNGYNNEKYIRELDKSPENELFNILRIISTVPHYKEMIKVPLQLENAMRGISKDYENVINMSTHLIKNGYKIDNDKALRKIVRYVNDRKIHDFFVSLDFKYITESGLKTTSNKEGLIKLKTHIEQVIYPKVKNLLNKSEYIDNIFISQLHMNNMTLGLFGEEIRYISLFTNLNKPENIDQTLLIKDAFYDIQNIEIDGHTIFDWFFIYDLLVNKHSIGANSITQLFDSQLNLDSESSIVRKWVKFVNDYDSINLPYSNYENDLSQLGFELVKDSGEYQNRRSYNKSLYITPNEFPLFINKGLLGVDGLYEIKEIIKAFESGEIIIIRC